MKTTTTTMTMKMTMMIMTTMRRTTKKMQSTLVSAQSKKIAALFVAPVFALHVEPRQEHVQDKNGMERTTSRGKYKDVKDKKREVEGDLSHCRHDPTGESGSLTLEAGLLFCWLVA